jgi:hypothetical protein
VVESQMPVSTCSQLGGRAAAAGRAPLDRRIGAGGRRRRRARRPHSQQVSCVVRACRDVPAVIITRITVKVVFYTVLRATQSWALTFSAPSSL